MPEDTDPRIRPFSFYYKGDKPREDSERILKYYAKEKSERPMRNRVDYLELDKGGDND